ncbi:MAG: homoserine dehydrogenase [Phycisphaerales bacterium]
MSGTTFASPAPLERAPAATRTLRVALLGCGNIGGALAKQLASRPEIEVCAALVRDPARPRPGVAGPVTDRIEEVLATRPDLVVECLGGIDLPAELCRCALHAGVHVVSANKSMVAHALPALSAAARRSGARLRFDAAVCAGVPVLESVARLRAARVRSVRGIVNGTCNFILHSMGQRGIDLPEALAEATALGYAEPDPSADLGGRDSAEKLCLLAAAAGHGSVEPARVAVRGIAADGPDAGVDRALLQDVRTLGHGVRSVVQLDAGAHGLELLVAPTVVRHGGALAESAGTQNVVLVETELAGAITLCGPGAGAHPTVAALLADIDACVDSGAGWAQQAIAPARLSTQPAARRWLLRVGTPGGVPSPTQLSAAVLGAGASLQGAACLPGRALLEIAATQPQERALVGALAAQGLRVQSLAIEEDATLRF